ncbi:MAG: hypothetical protein ACRCVU_20190 [Flavobacterium sp.]
MKINRLAKLGLFEYQKDRNEGGLMIYDFSQDKCIRFENYREWRINAISPDGKYIAINKISETTRAFKTDFAIVCVDTQEQVFFTNAYFVYDAEFSATSDKVLLVVHNKKPFCLDIETKEIVAEMPKNIRTYQGDFNSLSNQFIAPSETFKDTVYLFDFKTGDTAKIKLNLKEKIIGMKYTNDQQHLIVLTESSVVYYLDEEYKTIWSIDFKTVFEHPVRINSSTILFSEDGKHLLLETSSTETNNWGAEFAVSIETGELVNTVEGYQFRGRVKDALFDNKVILYTFHTLDMLSGEVKELKLNLV